MNANFTKLPKLGYAALSVLLLGCSSLPVYQSKDLSEADDLRYFQEKIMYDIFNDGTNLELRMEVPEMTTQIKILRFGFTVWVDQSGKKKMEHGIAYPIGGSTKFDRSQMSGAGQQPSYGADRSAQIMKLQERFKEKPQMMKIMGFGEEVQVYNLLYDQPDIRAKIDFDSNLVMTYSLIIPLNQIYSETTDRAEPVSLGLISGSMEMPSMGGGPPGGMGGGGGGPGGAMGGGRPPGGGGFNSQRMEQMMEMTEPVKIWFKVSVPEN